MSTIPTPTPEVVPDINSSAADIRAAMLSTTPPAAPPPPEPTPAVPSPEPGQTPAPVAAPPAPPADWGSVAKNPDGTYQVTLATGEVFKGTADDVIAKQAEAHVNTKRWAQGIKDKHDTPPVVDPPATPQLSNEDMQAAEWIAGMLEKNPAIAKRVMAAASGVPVEQFESTMSNMVRTTAEAQLNNEWLSFHQICPDFVDTPANTQALVEYFPKEVLEGKRIVSAGEMKQAYALAIYDGKLKPVAAAPAAQPTTYRGAVPMPASQGAPAQGGYDDKALINMDANKLRELMNGGGR